MDISEELNLLTDGISCDSDLNLSNEIWENFKIELGQTTRLTVNGLIKYKLLDKAFEYMIENDIESNKSFHSKIMSELKNRTSIKELTKYISMGIDFELPDASFAFGTQFLSKKDVLIHLYKLKLINKKIFMFNSQCWLSNSEKGVILSYEL